jgi:Na+/H+-dicarboxylate symporter
MNLEPGQSAVIVALAMGINPLLDMFETANNVAGDNVCTYVVAETQNMIEKE